MARKPTLAGTEAEARIKELRAEGRSVDYISSSLYLPRRQVQTVIEGLKKEEVGKLKLTPPPAEDPNWTPRQRAEAHSSWVKSQLDAAVSSGEASVRDIATLSTQYVNAQRLVAKLSGALDVTEAQVIRTTAFSRCLAALERAIGDNREVWERWEKELAVLVGETDG